MDRSVLSRKPMTELKDIASHLDMRGFQKLRKAELIDAIIRSGTEAGGQQSLDTGSGPAGGATGADDAAGGDAEGSRSEQRGTEEASAAASPEEGPGTTRRGPARQAEESARKVLPPGAQATDDRGTDGRSASTGEDGPQPGEERSGRDAAEDRAGGSGRARAAAAGEANGDGASGRGASGGGESGGRASGEDAGSRAGADEDDDDPISRKRRNRRDRRKRNRDRQAEESSSAESASDEAADGRQGRGQPDPGRGGRHDQGQAGGGQSGGGQSGGGQSGGGQGGGGQGGQPSPSGSAAKGGGGGNEPGEVRAGVLDILPEGYGFLRTTGYLPGERDVYVSQGQIRKHGLRRGDVVQGHIRQQRNNEKVPALHHVQKVNGEELEAGQVPERPTFEQLPVTVSDERLDITAGQASLAMRVLDLVAPLGRGQRSLILCPPRSAKGELLRDLADAIAEATPDAHLMLVMIDERPEAIAELDADIDGEVIASTFDATAEDHTQIAELAVERARRLVELGHDVVVILDSLTRLARAYGVTTGSSGRTIAPGLDAASLYPPKRIMSAARTIADGGSLTIIATALTDTGSVLDEAILHEFRRTAGAEVVLDPTLTLRRVHPAISVLESAAVDEARLQDAEELATLRRLRRTLEGMAPAEATERVLDKLAQTEHNDDFLAQVLKSGL